MGRFDGDKRRPSGLSMDRLGIDGAAQSHCDEVGDEFKVGISVGVGDAQRAVHHAFIVRKIHP